MILTFIAVLTAMSVALVFAAGAAFAQGLWTTGLAAAALGAGWLGLIYSCLLRELARLEGKD